MRRERGNLVMARDATLSSLEMIDDDVVAIAPTQAVDG